MQYTPAGEGDNFEQSAKGIEANGEEKRDEDSGNRTPVRYYYNSKTKVSCWERPPGALCLWVTTTVLSVADAFRSAGTGCEINILSGSAEPLSWECIRTRGGTKTDWFVVITNGGGRFFCNRKRGESHWVLPDEVAALLRGDDASAAGDGTQTELGFYQAVENAAVRAEFSLDSDTVGVLGVGDVIEVLEAKRNDAGKSRVNACWFCPTLHALIVVHAF